MKKKLFINILIITIMLALSFRLGYKFGKDVANKEIREKGPFK